MHQTDISRSPLIRNNTPVLTARQLEEQFSIPRSSQKRQRTLGNFIPYFRVGNRVYYRRDAVEGWIARQEAINSYPENQSRETGNDI